MGLDGKIEMNRRRRPSKKKTMVRGCGFGRGYSTVNVWAE
jgi:hypothetical protein